MLNTLIESMKTALLRAGASPVYSAFDAVRTDRKEKGIYTIVGIDSFESFLHKILYPSVSLLILYQISDRIELCPGDKKLSLMSVKSSA